MSNPNLTLEHARAPIAKVTPKSKGEQVTYLIGVLEQLALAALQAAPRTPHEAARVALASEQGSLNAAWIAKCGGGITADALAMRLVRLQIEADTRAKAEKHASRERALSKI